MEEQPGRVVTLVTYFVAAALILATGAMVEAFVDPGHGPIARAVLVLWVAYGMLGLIQAIRDAE